MRRPPTKVCFSTKLWYARFGEILGHRNNGLKQEDIPGLFLNDVHKLRDKTTGSAV
jgi:hypothetical protein